MIDTSIPRIGLCLKNDMTNEFSEPVLPEGFKFVRYQDGEENRRNWSEILCSVGFFGQNVEEGIVCFGREFADRIELAEKRIFFIITEDGKYVGTCAAWEDRELKRGRLHWLGVRPEYQKNGLGRALVDKVLYTFKTELEGWPVYLLTQTTSHIAVCLYMKKGFYPVYQDEESKAKLEKAVEVLNSIMREKDYKEFVDKVKEDIFGGDPMEKPVLRFNDGGNFRILMISDFHAGDNYNPKLKRGIEALLEETKPDFVMVGGDQCIKRDSIEDVRDYMADIMEPVITRKIPWGTVFGNHDREMGIDIADEEKAYEMIPYCMSESGPEEIHGIGNYCLSILSSKDDKPAFNIWAMDSNRDIEDYAEMFGMDKSTRFRLPDHFNEGANGATPLFDQIQWYYNGSLKMEKENGKKIPGVMFMHIPLPEYLEICRNPEECNARGDKREACGATEINSGLFLAGLQRGDMKGYFFGHEHLIDIQGEYCGVILACDAAIGYNMSAHDDLRGGRVIDLCEDGTISTRTVKLIDLLGKDAMRDPSYMEGGCHYFIRKL